MASSKYVVNMHMDLGYHSNSNGQFPLFGEQAGAVALLPSETDQLQHAFVEEIKSSGMEQLARDSGLLSERGSIPTLRLVVPSRRDSQRDMSEAAAAAAAAAAQDESSASYTSPVKRGRGRGRGAAGERSGSASKRSKSRRSRSGGGGRDGGRDGGGGGGSQGTQGQGIPTKGLRHFSLAVCNKVRDKAITTYNEVADELVADFDEEESKNDEKNIRRRVYDALNVLSAMDIIRKARELRGRVLCLFVVLMGVSAGEKGDSLGGPAEQQLDSAAGAGGGAAEPHRACCQEGGAPDGAGQPAAPLQDPH